MNTLSANWPDVTIPDHQKDEAWHKQYCDSILAAAAYGFTEMDKAARYYMGVMNPEEDHYHLVMSEGNSLLPVDMLSLRSIAKYVDRLTGDLLANQPKPTVKALSKNAINRKADAALTMTVDFMLRPLMEMEQSSYGMPTVRQGAPETPDELEIQIRNYKETGELIYQRLLEDFLAKNNFDEKMLLLFKDFIVKGGCFIYNANVGTDIKPEHIRPQEALWDASTDDLFGREDAFIGFARYKPLSYLRARYNLSDEEVKSIKSKGNVLMIGGRKYLGWNEINGELYGVEVVTFWKDTQYQTATEKKNSKGVVLYGLNDRDIDPRLPEKTQRNAVRKRKEADNVEDVPVEIIRKCTVLGNQFVVDWGIQENQVRSYDDWQKTGFPIKRVASKMYDGYMSSLSIDLIGLAILYDEAWHKLRQAFKKDKGMLMLYDVGQMPAKMKMWDVTYYEDVYSKIPINSQVIGGFSAPFNQYTAVDTRLKYEHAMGYIAVIKALDEEMTKISGVSEGRQGGISAASVGVGVHEASIINSNLMTKHYFFTFSRFLEEVFDHVIGHRKIFLLNNPDRLKHIIGDDGYEFLMKDKDFQLDDYGSYIFMDGLSEYQNKMIQEMTKFAVQNGGLDYYMGLKVMLETNPHEALAELEKHRVKIEQQQKEAQEMAMQQQQMAMQQQGQMQMQMEGGKAQTKLAAEGIKGQAMKEVATIAADSKMRAQLSKNSADAFQRRMENINNRINNRQ